MRVAFGNFYVGQDSVCDVVYSLGHMVSSNVRLSCVRLEWFCQLLCDTFDHSFSRLRVVNCAMCLSQRLCAHHSTLDEIAATSVLATSTLGKEVCALWRIRLTPCSVSMHACLI